MKKMNFLSLILTLVLTAGLFTTPAMASSVDEMEILGSAALLVDADHDEVLFAQDAYEKRYPASITKVMTALLTVEAIGRGDLYLDQVITANNSAVRGMSESGSTQNIRTGEQLTVEQLLYCILVVSANEAANILAEAVAGTQEAFVEQMNQRAAELGCTGTHFVNTHGIHDDDHYTTAYDIYLIAREAMRHELFRTIVATDEYYIEPTNMTKQRRHFLTTNYLLSAKRIPGYTYKSAIGIKTGSTDEAGYCLVSAAVEDDKTLYAVVMGAENVRLESGGLRREVFTESKRLLQWGFTNFSRQTLLQAGMPTQEVPVTLSKEAQHVMVVPDQSLEATLPNDVDPETFQKTIQLPESVTAPVEEGQVLGTLTLSYDGKEYGTVNLVARNSVAMSNMLLRQQQLGDFFGHWWFKIALAAVLLAIAILILRLTVFRRSRRYGHSHYTGRASNYRGGRRRR